MATYPNHHDYHHVTTSGSDLYWFSAWIGPPLDCLDLSNSWPSLIAGNLERRKKLRMRTWKPKSKRRRMMMMLALMTIRTMAKQNEVNMTTWFAGFASIWRAMVTICYNNCFVKRMTSIHMSWDIHCTFKNQKNINVISNYWPCGFSWNPAPTIWFQQVNHYAVGLVHGTSWGMTFRCLSAISKSRTWPSSSNQPLAFAFGWHVHCNLCWKPFVFNLGTYLWTRGVRVRKARGSSSRALCREQQPQEYLPSNARLQDRGGPQHFDAAALWDGKARPRILI